MDLIEKGPIIGNIIVIRNASVIFTQCRFQRYLYLSVLENTLFTVHNKNFNQLCLNLFDNYKEQNPNDIVKLSLNIHSE
jgi:hypothetical protein